MRSPKRMMTTAAAVPEYLRAGRAQNEQRRELLAARSN
jgi:hypothetical protein